MELQIKELIECQGELITRVLSEQQERYMAVTKLYFKSLIASFICMAIISAALGICLIYQTYQSYNYDGAGIKDSYNATMGANSKADTNGTSYNYEQKDVPPATVVTPQK